MTVHPMRTHLNSQRRALLFLQALPRRTRQVASMSQNHSLLTIRRGGHKGRSLEFIAQWFVLVACYFLGFLALSPALSPHSSQMFCFHYASHFFACSSSSTAASVWFMQLFLIDFRFPSICLIRPLLYFYPSLHYARDSQAGTPGSGTV